MIAIDQRLERLCFAIHKPCGQHVVRHALMVRQIVIRFGEYGGMQAIDLLKLQSDIAFKELLDSIDGLTEEQSWGRVELLPDEYMHAEGSILSTLMHMAAPKFVYGSVAYRGSEVRWRDTVDRLEQIWPSWDAAKAYLHEAQAYWRSTWENETDLERFVKNFRDKDLPSWKIITTVTLHDAYHAGQIQLIRATVAPSSTPPPSETEAWRRDCGGLPSW